MRKPLYMLLLLSLNFMFSGCAICPPGYLDDYATVGGKWQRSNPSRGRVGSILSDAGATVGAQAAVIGDAYYEPGMNSGYPYESGYVDPNYNGQTYYQGESLGGEYYQSIDSSAMPAAEGEQYSTAPVFDASLIDGTSPGGGSRLQQAPPQRLPASQSSPARSILE